MTDTNYYYAAFADSNFETPEEDPKTCSECDSFDECPCPAQCHWGICTKDGTWVNGEVDACKAFENAGDAE